MFINHSPLKPSWIINEQGVTVKGTHDDEILVRYSISDPLRRFIQYGFNCDEPFGFSMFTLRENLDGFLKEVEVGFV